MLLRSDACRGRTADAVNALNLARWSSRAVSAMHMSPLQIDDSQFIKVDMSIEGQKHQKWCVCAELLIATSIASSALAVLRWLQFDEVEWRKRSNSNWFHYFRHLHTQLCRVVRGDKLALSIKSVKVPLIVFSHWDEFNDKQWTCRKTLNFCKWTFSAFALLLSQCFSVFWWSKWVGSPNLGPNELLPIRWLIDRV